MWNYNRQAYAPHIPAAGVTIPNWLAGQFYTYWQTSKETCPGDYRRPNDGANNTTVHNSNGYIPNSEMRQSLWVGPPIGFNLTGSYTAESSRNSVWGYYADGFFDRRQIVSSLTGAANSAVAAGSYAVAYQGNLFYNPVTYASLFFPAAGDRGASTDIAGLLELTGSWGEYWSSSSQGIMTGSMLMFFSSSAQTMAPGKSYGFSIRCVKD